MVSQDFWDMCYGCEMLLFGVSSTAPLSLFEDANKWIWIEHSNKNKFNDKQHTHIISSTYDVYIVVLYTIQTRIWTFLWCPKWIYCCCHSAWCTLTLHRIHGRTGHGKRRPIRAIRAIRVFKGVDYFRKKTTETTQPDGPAMNDGEVGAQPLGTATPVLVSAYSSSNLVPRLLELSPRSNLSKVPRQDCGSGQELTNWEPRRAKKILLCLVSYGASMKRIVKWF